MVHISQTSSVNQKTQPLAYQWDSLVRKNFQRYQQLIDAKTYQLQRTQRLPFSLQYPRFYNSDLLVLNLLKAKQQVGEVVQQEVNLYKSINSGVRSDFNKTFDNTLLMPKLGVAVGTGMFAFGSVFNWSIPMRAVLFITPIFIDYLRTTSDCRNQARTKEFLDWVKGYRTARCQAEKVRKQLHTDDVKKIVGDNNLNELAKQIISLAQGQK